LRHVGRKITIAQASITADIFGGSMDSRLRQHSSVIVDGPSRAPARAYFYAIGLTDADLAKPLVGICASWPRK
jgi:dihydroxyacid dehydratase/phosphogluconate dehydratase